MVKNPPVNAGDVRDAGSVCGFRSFPGGGHGIPFQCSCLENPVDTGVWWDTAYRVTHNRTWLKWLSPCACVALFQMLGTHELNTVNRDLCSDEAYILAGETKTIDLLSKLFIMLECGMFYEIRCRRSIVKVVTRTWKYSALKEDWGQFSDSVCRTYADPSKAC